MTTVGNKKLWRGCSKMPACAGKVALPGATCCDTGKAPLLTRHPHCLQGLDPVLEVGLHLGQAAQGLLCL